MSHDYDQLFAKAKTESQIAHVTFMQSESLLDAVIDEIDTRAKTSLESKKEMTLLLEDIRKFALEQLGFEYKKNENPEF